MLWQNTGYGRRGKGQRDPKTAERDGAQPGRSILGDGGTGNGLPAPHARRGSELDERLHKVGVILYFWDFEETGAVALMVVKGARWMA